jgi:Tol biopolymer transport system component
MPDVQEVFRMATQNVRPDPGALERQHRTQRRRVARRKVGVYVLVAAVAALAVVVATTLPKSQPKPPANPAPALDAGGYVLELSTGTLTPLPPAAAEGREFDASGDGTRIAFTAEPSGTPQIQVMNIDGSGIRTVTHDPFGADFGTWSPDGTRIAYAGYGHDHTDRSVFVVDLATGESTRLTSERGDVDRMDWSPDGERILYAVAIGSAPDPDGFGAGAIFQLRSVDVRTGQVHKLAGNHDRLASEGTWSPDGARIAFNRGVDSTSSLGFDPAEIWTMDADGTNQRRLLAIDAPAIGAVWSPDGSRIAYTQADEDEAVTYVVDVASGERRPVGLGAFPTWLDDDTLIVEIL